MRLVIVAMTALALASCAQYDKQVMTEFRPLGDGTYEFMGMADAAYPLGSSDAEAVRIGWLEGYLKDNGLCRVGYEITDRKPVLVQKGALGNLYRVYYQVRCLDAASGS